MRAVSNKSYTNRIRQGAGLTNPRDGGKVTATKRVSDECQPANQHITISLILLQTPAGAYMKLHNEDSGCILFHSKDITQTKDLIAPRFFFFLVSPNAQLWDCWQEWLEESRKKIYRVVFALKASFENITEVC